VTTCTCMIQAGQIPDAVQAALAARLDAYTQQHFGSAADINWVQVAPGAAFTAGAPSTTSVVSISSPEPVEQSRRIELLDALCALWTEETRCNPDELVAVVADPRAH